MRDKPILKVETLAVLGRGAVLHASCVAFEGRAFVFLAKSGGGKTTISRILERAGGTVIGDDVTIVSRGTDGVLRAMPCGSFRPDSITRPPAAVLSRFFFLEFGNLVKIPLLDDTYAFYRAMRQSQVMVMRYLDPADAIAASEGMREAVRRAGAGILRFSLEDGPAAVRNCLLE